MRMGLGMEGKKIPGIFGENSKVFFGAEIWEKILELLVCPQMSAKQFRDQNV